MLVKNQTKEIVMLDVAIVGGGPAGLTAGLYAVRGGASVRLFEELFAGGQIVKTHRIDNYPGISDGPDGFRLAAMMEDHAGKFGLAVDYLGVERMELSEEAKVLHLSDGTVVSAKTVILCMGASPRKLNIEGEERLTGAGISYCATCDGAFFKDRVATVIGGGDTAISDAIYLSNLCKTVYVVHRRDTLRASAVLQKAAMQQENIRFVWNCIPLEFLGEDALTGIRLKNVDTGEESVLETDGAFVAVGITPRSGSVQGQVVLDNGGFIVTDARMETSIRGVFAAGDIRNTPLRQVVTACADGAIAATCAMEAARA